MATQLINWSGNSRKLLDELNQLPADMEVWEEASTRTAYAGNDIENNPDYDARYIGTVAEVRAEL